MTNTSNPPNEWAELEEWLKLIVQNHDKLIADKKRGFPAGTQQYFTVNRILALFVEADRNGRLDELGSIKLDYGPYQAETFIDGKQQSVLDRINQLEGKDNEDS